MTFQLWIIEHSRKRRTKKWIYMNVSFFFLRKECWMRISFSHTLHKKCLYSELIWSVYSLIRTEYGELLHISPHSVRMRENTDQNNSEYGHFSRRDSYELKQLCKCSVKQMLLKNSVKFKGKYLCLSIFLIKS